MKNSLLLYWSAVAVMFLGAIVFFFKLLPVAVNNRELLFSVVTVICLLSGNILFTVAVYEQNREKGKENS
jgi:bacteriorhodopsin